ncbi:hypothetical protein RYX56_15120 [Alkalihalophilus lindianensis]|uniref:Uncharacterized protein n=1 Tax=Alkalihalophilus lindianensis TaxID=1630542 RepID=A0ABU3XCU5_9BACI|nr:hypothetical protein [Alkalihalophilus lindianensis]MDV2685695.1 hypothetical protein [Alkalihalophilus lindianensis]
MKFVLISLAVLFQLLTILFVFINITWALLAVGGNVASFLAVLIVFMLERKKEKEEEIDYENSDY